MTLPLRCVSAIFLAGYGLTAATNNIRPLVVWHGLGDNYASPGILQFEDEVKSMHPGIYVHSVYIERDTKEDQHASFVSGALIVRHIYEAISLVWRRQCADRTRGRTARIHP